MGVHSRWPDFFLILLPPFVGTGLILLFHDFFNSPTPFAFGLFLTLGLSIGHQFSMGFRTYFDFDELKQRPLLYTSVPLLSFLLAFSVYSFGELTYWRVMSYIAIIHFIRQQYGFMAIFRRKSLGIKDRFAFMDTAFIYVSMLYPLLFEHINAPRAYSWADFDVIIPMYIGSSEKFIFPLYLLAGFLYLSKEVYLYLSTRHFNFEKNMVIWGTALSWYVGLVATNADFSFFFATQIMHSIPYIALIWMYENKKTKGSKFLFSKRGIPFYISAILALAYVETGLWSSYSGDDLLPFFEVFKGFGKLDPSLLRWLIPMITVPQLTHYFLDAFIWRLKKGDRRWTQHIDGNVSAQPDLKTEENDAVEGRIHLTPNLG